MLLNGKMLTGRDAPTSASPTCWPRARSFPVDFTNRVIYYVGPEPGGDEARSPAPPPPPAWTNYPHDAGETGLISMIGNRARPRRHRRSGQQVRLPDGCRRRRLPGGQGDQVGQGRWFRQISAWKPSMSSTFRTCRSRWLPILPAPRSTTPALKGNGRSRSARFRSRPDSRHRQ